MLGARISDKAMADASIGRICSYGTGEGREYGRICRVTASELVLDRLSLTEGRFEPHPIPVCPSSRNRVTYLKRFVCLVEEEEEDEGIPRTYPHYPGRIRFFPPSLPVYVRLPGATKWRAELFKGLFYVQHVLDGVNEWHLVNSYRKRFNVKGTSSTEGLQAIYVESGLHANQSLAQLLIELSDEDLAQVGSAVAPPLEAKLTKTLTDKETKLLEALLKANRLKTLAERVRVLECETRELRESASFYEDDDPSKWPAEILECEALEERVKKLNATEKRIEELRLLLKTV